jgi:hypothetical protein
MRRGLIHWLVSVVALLPKNLSICFVTKFGLSSGMKCPVFGNVIPVILLATFSCLTKYDAVLICVGTFSVLFGSAGLRSQ